MTFFLWILSVLGAVAGGVQLLLVEAQPGAPQQAAAAAIAVGLAVIPYCLARAVSELLKPQAEALNKLIEHQQTQIKLLAALANKE